MKALFRVAVAALVLSFAGGLAFATPENELPRGQEYRDSFSGVERIVVVTGIADVQVRGEASASTELRIEDLSDRDDVEVGMDGATLEVRVLRRESGPQLRAPEIYIRSPRNVNLNVTVTTGDIDVTEIRGDVNLTATTGDIDIDAVEGPMGLQTTTGSIDVDDVRGRLAIRATTGNIDIDGFVGPLGVVTTTGRVVGDDISIEEGGRVITTTGRVDLDFDLDEIDNLGFNARSITGTIRIGGARVPSPLAVPGEPSVDIVTTTGSITVQ